MLSQQQFQAVLRLNAPARRDQLDLLAAQHPMEFRTWAMAWISKGGHGPGARLLLRLLHQKSLLLSLLVNPGAMPLRDAIRVAKLAQHSIANFDWAIANTIQNGTETQAARALQVLQHLHLSRRIVPGLAAALRNRNVRVRSLVSKLLGRLCDNPTTIRALFEDRDARVRANAVEGLWGSDHAVARDLLRLSVRDADNRVAANAALGLSKLGEPGGIEALRRMSGHSDPRYRISAAWAIGQTADRTLSPVLELLAEDPLPKVRDTARTSLGRVLDPDQRAASLMVAVSHANRTPEGGIRLRAFVADGEDVPVDLSADCFRLFCATEEMPRLEISTPAWRDALVTVLWLADGELSCKVQDQGREGILAAMHSKRPDDLHCVVGSGVRPMLSLSSDLGQLADSLRPASRGQREPTGAFQSLLRALTVAGSRAGCRTVIVFAGGLPFPEPANVELLIQHAVKSEIAIHVVVFANTAVARVWSQISSATQGSFRMVDDEMELQDVFWSVFSEISSAYAITYGPPAKSGVGPDEDYRLEVRSATGFGQARFQPLPLNGGM